MKLLQQVNEIVSNEPLDEGWKTKIGGIVLAAAAAASIVQSNPIEIRGQRYEKSTQKAPDNAEIAVATHNGKTITVKFWTQRSSAKHGGNVNLYQVEQ